MHIKCSSVLVVHCFRARSLQKWLEHWCWLHTYLFLYNAITHHCDIDLGQCRWNYGHLNKGLCHKSESTWWQCWGLKSPKVSAPEAMHHNNDIVLLLLDHIFRNLATYWNMALRYAMVWRGFLQKRNKLEKTWLTTIFQKKVLAFLFLLRIIFLNLLISRPRF